MQFIAFLIFSAVLIAMYIGIRRQWAEPGLVAGVGALGSIAAMTLFMLARDMNVAYGLLAGTVVGTLFTAATLSVAWYFHSNELRATHGQAQASEYYDE